MLDPTQVAIEIQKARLKHMYGATEHKSRASAIEQEPPTTRRWGTMQEAMAYADRERQRAGMGNVSSMRRAREWLEQHGERKPPEMLVTAVAKLLDEVEALKAERLEVTNNA